MKNTISLLYALTRLLHGDTDTLTIAVSTPTKDHPKMETAQLLALLIPALTQIAHDAITCYYRLHGDQSANLYADATDAEKQATTAAVTNHLNGNPDCKTVPGIIVGTVVNAATSAIESVQSPMPNQSIPLPQVTEIHAPTNEALPSPVPGTETPGEHFPPM
jgi:hypothetical protein